jgi:hypothetical protein
MPQLIAKKERIEQLNKEIAETNKLLEIAAKHCNGHKMLIEGLMRFPQQDDDIVRKMIQDHKKKYKYYCSELEQHFIQLDNLKLELEKLTK